MFAKPRKKFLNNMFYSSLQQKNDTSLFNVWIINIWNIINM